MENTNVGGGKDQMPSDRRKEPDAGKKTGQQGGSSQDWQPHDDEGSESKPSGGSTKQNDASRSGGQQYPGGQSGPSRQSGQPDQSKPTSNPAK